VEPFFVICETCRARLKVRSESAIGQIHACPRCESMVLIAPPASGTGTDLALPQPVVRRAPQFARVETPSQEAADAFAAAAVAVLTGTVATASAEPMIDVHTTMATVHGGSAAASAGVVPAALKAIWLERPLMLLGAAGASVVVAGALAGAIWPRGDNVAASAATSPTTAIAQAATVPSNTSSTARAETTTESATVPSTAAASVDVAPPDGTELGNMAPPVEPAPQPAAPAEIALPLTQRDSQPPVEPQPAAVTQQPAPTREPVFAIDPLDFDPSRLSVSSAGTPPPSGGETLASASLSAAPVDAPPSAERSTESATALADDDEQIEIPTITVRRGPPASGPTQLPTIPSRLAVPVQAMKLQPMRLARFVDQMSEAVGVPITLDPAALEMTGVSPRREVTVDVKQATFEQVLRDVLVRHRMELVDRDGGLVIARTANSAALPSSLDVKDLLTSGETNASRLAALIQRFVAPDSWQQAGGTGELAVHGTTIDIKQSEAAHIGVIVFCERLRIARGLAPKTRYPIELLGTESPYARLTAKLGQRTTFTYVPWTRLADVLRDWQQRSGLTILVDWQALAGLELDPSSPISASAIARTWEDALDGILDPLGLAWWAVDGETIQITSGAASGRLARVEFFKLPSEVREQFANDVALVDELRRAAAKNDVIAEAPLEMEVVSDHLITLASIKAHRFLTKRLAGK
jgi:hypothetical protein